MPNFWFDQPAPGISLQDAQERARVTVRELAKATTAFHNFNMLLSVANQSMYGIQNHYAYGQGLSSHVRASSRFVPSLDTRSLSMTTPVAVPQTSPAFRALAFSVTDTVANFLTLADATTGIQSLLQDRLSVQSISSLSYWMPSTGLFTANGPTGEVTDPVELSLRVIYRAFDGAGNTRRFTIMHHTVPLFMRLIDAAREDFIDPNVLKFTVAFSRENIDLSGTYPPNHAVSVLRSRIQTILDDPTWQRDILTIMNWLANHDNHRLLRASEGYAANVLPSVRARMATPPSTQSLWGQIFHSSILPSAMSAHFSSIPNVDQGIRELDF